MLNPKIAKMLNEQVNKELHSSYLYLDMANYYYDNNLNGFGNWFDVQTEEEKAHGLLFIQYLRNNGEKIILDEGDYVEMKSSYYYLYDFIDVIKL